MGGTSSRTLESMWAEGDTQLAKALESILAGLTPAERNAVHHVHLGAVYRFPQVGAAVEQAYARAMRKIWDGLAARGIV